MHSVRMICSETEEEREAALAKILARTAGRLRKNCMKHWKVTRLLSVSLIHRFMSSFLQTEEDIKKLADSSG